LINTIIHEVIDNLSQPDLFNNSHSSDVGLQGTDCYSEVTLIYYY